MSTFDSAIPVVLTHEGGWVCDPADPGGETNFGISSLIIQREGITNADLGLPEGRQPGWMKPMGVDAAKAIYQRLFWDRYGYGQLTDQTVATKIFDACVNMGAHHAHPLAQAAANGVVGSDHLTVDGVLGPASMKVIDALDPHSFVKAYTAQLYGYYNGIAAQHPALRKFLSNWLRRASWGT